MDYLDAYPTSFNQDLDWVLTLMETFLTQIFPLHLLLLPNQVLDQGLVICLKEKEVTCLEH